MKLDFITGLSAVELALKVTAVVQETVEVVRQSLGTGLKFDIFLVLGEWKIRFIMKSVWPT